MDKIYITEAGKAMYQEKIMALKAKVADIQEEKSIAYTASGDGWHDNPGFNQLEQMEHRVINELTALLAKVESATVVVLEKRPTDTVQIGSLVRVVQHGPKPGQSQECVYEIVGHGESQVALKKIAYDTPIGKALLGKKAGDRVAVRIPAGQIELEIFELLQ
jgi:transcription elongation GreA/GreB family factor